MEEGGGLEEEGTHWTGHRRRSTTSPLLHGASLLEEGRGGGRVVTRSTLTVCARVGRDKEEALYADLYISRVPIDTCRMHLKQHNFSQR